MTTAVEVAHWFVGSIDREAGDSITHLKVQKLVFYAQAWSLALLDRPLFDEDLQAWAHGPVAESVYREYEGSSWNALPCPDVVPSFDEDVETLLTDVFGAYAGFSAKDPEEMTHAERPWKEARGDLPPEARSKNIIKKELMRSFYGEMYPGDGEQEQ